MVEFSDFSLKTVRAVILSQPRRGSHTTMNAGDPCRCSSGEQPVDIRRRNFTGSARESDLSIVPVVSQGEQSLGRGKGQYFYHVSEEVKERGLHRACWKLQKNF